ncbi:MAG: ParA family protein [Spirochaetaceae bacterium]|nr:ParA family protein [Spirochaetaceae bacterium]
MRTIALISMKGGSGKTTLALHLANAATEHGHNVAVLDLDPQQSAAKWGDRRSAAVPVVLAAPPSRLGQDLERVATAGADVVVIDTPPRAGSDNAAIAAAKVADLVVLPCRPAILDLETVASTAARVRDVAQVPVVVVLNGCPSRGNATEDAAAALIDLGLEVCPVRIGQRVAFARSLLDGRTAPELEPSGRAAAETARLHTFIACTD